LDDPETGTGVSLRFPGGATAYIEHNNPSGAAADINGWGDVSFLQKFRLFAGNKEHGDYILTLFPGESIPTES
jgi:hypothetical protein